MIDMKKLMAICVLALVGCYNDPQSTNMEGNGVKVELLFVKDSIRVYRFSDGERYHYFTDRLETISTANEGKTQIDENIK
jgi:hypothetical protein